MTNHTPTPRDLARDALLLRIADQLAELPKMAAQLAEVLRIVEALPELHHGDCLDCGPHETDKMSGSGSEGDRK